MAVVLKKKSMSPASKVFLFGKETHGDASMKEILGGKGANLAEMSSLGIPVPSGFTIPTSMSVRYMKASKFPSSLTLFFRELDRLVESGVQSLVVDGVMPLLSVRSGARVSMPGMMDTILNVGLTQDTIEYWESRIGVRAAWDSYRRLIQMYSSVALGVPMERFEAALSLTKKMAQVDEDSQLTAIQLKILVSRYYAVLEEEGVVFPQTLKAQLRGAIKAVFSSWSNPRAIEYRKIHGIPNDWGTAVNVQSMVFGNMGDTSATGVVFTRCPSTGTKVMTGEFLVNAQGEDVVSGVRTPEPIAKLWGWDLEIGHQLESILVRLEQHYMDMQDVEFTVQDGELFILQTRSGKRTAKAAFKIAHDLADEGLITKKEAVKRVNQKMLFSAVQPSIDPKFVIPPSLVGIAGGGGVVSGVAVFSSQSAINCKEPCILVREETSPDDIGGMNASVGILTSTGGLTSHAAVVARGMGKTCVVGATELHINGNVALVGTAGQVLTEGDLITIDGSDGRVWFKDSVPIVGGERGSEVSQILMWASSGKFAERIDLYPGMDMDVLKGELSKVLSGEVYISTAILDFNPDEASELMVNVGEALNSFNGDRIVLDLSGIGESLNEVDSLLPSSMDGTGSKSVLEEKVAALGLWPQSVAKKTVIEGIDHCGNLKYYGFLVATEVKTCADLIDANGPVRVSKEVIDTVFGGYGAFETIKSLVSSASKNGPFSFPLPPRYWYEVLEEVA